MGLVSNYNGFDVKIRHTDLTEELVPGATIKIYDATNLAELIEVVADVDGWVAPGTVDVPAGTVLRFRLENHLGMCGYFEDITVEVP